MDYLNYAFGIVPLDPYPSPAPAPSRLPAAYEQPWYVDTINRAIERAAQVATVQVAGYPPMPTFPAAPTVAPMPYPVQQQTQQSGAGIQLSTNTLMLIVGGFLLFSLGKRGR